MLRAGGREVNDFVTVETYSLLIPLKLRMLIHAESQERQVFDNKTKMWVVESQGLNTSCGYSP